MKKYRLYFELFGKKMQTEIVAADEAKAIEILKSKIIFYKIENITKLSKQDESTFEHLKKIFNF